MSRDLHSEEWSAASPDVLCFGYSCYPQVVTRMISSADRKGYGKVGLDPGHEVRKMSIVSDCIS